MGVISLCDMDTLVNLSLWGNIWLVVTAAMSSTTAVPLATAVAISTACLSWRLRGVDALDRVHVLGIKTVLGNSIREEVSRCLKVQAVIRISVDYFDCCLEEGMLDPSQEKADLLAFIVGVT